MWCGIIKTKHDYNVEDEMEMIMDSLGVRKPKPNDFGLKMVNKGLLIIFIIVMFLILLGFIVIF